MHRAARGSSPLARGLPLRGAESRSEGRIIPARAGFTGSSHRPAVAAGDHPRSRGVYLPGARYARCPLGSSPLARGLQLDDLPWDPMAGIIPARAGFTEVPQADSGHHGRIIPARAGFTRESPPA